MTNNISSFVLPVIAALTASCVTTSNTRPTVIDETWRADVYPNQYVALRDLLHLHKKEEDQSEGVTLLAVPAFHAPIGIEVIHKIRVAEGELNLANRPKYWLIMSTIKFDEPEKEMSSGVTKSVTRVEKYKMSLTIKEYKSLIIDIQNRVLS